MKKNVLKRMMAAVLSITMVLSVSLCVSATENNGAQTGGDYGVNYIYNTELKSSGTALSDTTMVIGNNSPGTLPTDAAQDGFVSASTQGYTGYAGSAKFEADVDGEIVIKTTHDANNNKTGNFAINMDNQVPSLKVDGFQSYSAHQIWEISVKLPSVEEGTWTRLFNYDGTRGYQCKITSSVMIAADKVYVLNRTGTWPEIGDGSGVYTSPDGTKLDMTLEANKYYRFVRVMDFSGSNVMSKVLVYGEENNLLAESEWLSVSGTDGWLRPATIAFQSCGYTDANVCFKNFNIYTPNAGVKDITVSTDSADNNIVSVYAPVDTVENRLAVSPTVGDDLIGFSGIHSRKIGDEGNQTTEYYSDNEFTFDVNLQNIVSAGDGVAKFIGYHTDNNWMNNGGVAYLLQVAEDGSVSTLYNSAGTPGTYAVTKKGAEETLKLDAHKWYSVKVTKKLENNSNTDKSCIFTITITEKETETVVADISNIKATNTVPANDWVGSFTLMSVLNMDYPILLDEITGAWWTSEWRGKYNVTGQIFADIDAEESGYSAGDDLIIKGGATDLIVYPTHNIAYVRSDSDIYSEGAKIINGTEIKIAFKSNMDEATVNKNNIQVLKNSALAENEYTLIYDSETCTATVAFPNGLADEDADYQLVVSNNLKTAQFELPILTGETTYKLIPIPQPKFTTAVTDAEGVTVSGYNADDIVKAAITFENYEESETPETCVVIIAEYNTDGTLLKNAKIAEPEMQNGTAYTETIKLTEENPTVKIFVWDSLNTLSPLAY